MFGLKCPECDSENIVCRGNVLVGMDFKAIPSRWRITSLLDIQSLNQFKCLDCNYESNNEWDFALDNLDSAAELIRNRDNKTVSDLEL